MSNELWRDSLESGLFRFKWFFRPVSFTVALVAGVGVLPLGATDGLLGVGLMLAVSSIGAGLFVWVSVVDRRRQIASSSAAVDLTRQWEAAIRAATQSSPVDGVVEVSGRGSELVAQARRLRKHELSRLDADVRFGWNSLRFLNLRGLHVRAAERENAHRAKRARETAIEAARSAIEREGLMTSYLGLSREAQRAVGDASEDALLAVEWATLALVAEAWISDGQFAALYGPWWRAVVSDTQPVWHARWSTLSLAGFWLTMVGIVIAPFVNQGAAGYVTLGVMGTGVAGWATGAVWGATHSIPWPEPVRTGGVSRVPSNSPLLHRVWRWPERIHATLRGISVHRPNRRSRNPRR